ncbi:hypothetical protein CERZMDRAFT_89994, partial [Cercospora zeae-maydis SCOH1-5]
MGWVLGQRAKTPPRPDQSRVGDREIRTTTNMSLWACWPCIWANRWKALPDAVIL